MCGECATSEENVDLVQRAIAARNASDEPSAPSGHQADTPTAWGTWVREGRISRIEQHGLSEDALNAVGLSE